MGAITNGANAVKYSNKLQIILTNLRALTNNLRWYEAVRNGALLIPLRSDIIDINNWYTPLTTQQKTDFNTLVDMIPGSPATELAQVRSALFTTIGPDLTAIMNAYNAVVAAPAFDGVLYGTLVTAINTLKTDVAAVTVSFDASF